MTDSELCDNRTGRNTRHSIAALLRQSIYSRLADYADTNYPSTFQRLLAMTGSLKNCFRQMCRTNLKRRLRTSACGVLIFCATGLQGSVRSVVAGDGQKISVEGRTLIATAANPQRSLASKSKGSVVVWGHRDLPPDGNDFVAIAATADYSLALRSNGSIVGWGFSYHGRLVPNNGNDFVAIAAGGDHSLALKSDGSIVAWGSNIYGQTNSPQGNDFVAIAAGWIHSLALKSDGSIVAWGDNRFGETRPPQGNDFVAIAAGYHHNLALKSDGSIVAWGRNNSGQAGPPQGNDFVAIAAGYEQSLALKSDGSIRAWGRNRFGEAEPPNGTDFVAIDADLNYSLALRSDGSIVAWGNKSSRLTYPPDGRGFVAIAAARDCGLALSKAPLVRSEAQKEGRKGSKQKHSEETKQINPVKDVAALKSVQPPPKMIRLIADDKMNVDLIYIEPGSFVMGRDMGLGERIASRISALGLVGKDPDDWPARKVKITRGFYIGKCKVTTAQFSRFLNTVPNPQDYVALNKSARIEVKDGAHVPKPYCQDCGVNVVHWAGAVAFCQWLSTKTGITVRLPTEAEWEYVARGPEAKHYPWKGTERVAWTESTAGEIDEEKRPYGWKCPPIDRYQQIVTPDGVVGMGGYIGEWCSDFYEDHHLKDDVIDPQGPQGEQLADKSINSVGEKYHVLRRGRTNTDRSRASRAGATGCYGLRIVVELPADKEALQQSLQE